MFTLIKIWLISLVVWPMILFAFMISMKALNKKNPAERREFAYHLGWTFISAGGIGAITGISGCITSFEIKVRVTLSLISIVLGLILTLSTRNKGV